MSENNQPGFFRRFWRAFIRLLAVVAVLLIIAGAAAAGYFGFLEIQRSFDSVAMRMDAMERTDELLRSDVTDLMEQELDRDVSTLQGQIEDVAAETAVLQSDLAAQAEQLSALLATMETAAATDETLSTNVADLSAALAALQGDINENGSRIDDLGGEIDRLGTAVTTLDGDVTAMQSEQEAFLADVAPVPETLALFRVWELVTRARFRLLENNAGLAAADVSDAILTVERLLVEAPEETAVSLQSILTRLSFALTNLPDDPDLAAADLENAWDELDAVLSQRVLATLPELPESEAAAVESEETGETEETEETAVSSTEEDTAEPTPTPAAAEETPTATATPEATTTPAPTATPTP